MTSLAISIGAPYTWFAPGARGRLSDNFLFLVDQCLPCASCAAPQRRNSCIVMAPSFPSGRRPVVQGRGPMQTGRPAPHSSSCSYLLSASSSRDCFSVDLSPCTPPVARGRRGVRSFVTFRHKLHRTLATLSGHRSAGKIAILPLASQRAVGTGKNSVVSPDPATRSDLAALRYRVTSARTISRAQSIAPNRLDAP
jgi:hypothetical protein